jgi:parallel beta-helix repeat protein
VHLQPGPSVEYDARQALLTAKPGTIVEFPAGNWQFTDELIVPVSHIVLRGAGLNRTTLDFTNQQTGAQGILGTADGFVIQNLRVLNPKGDGVRVEGADGVVFQGLLVEWNTEPENLHGAYGIYPVQCRNVLIDDSEVRGSSDAGIYVGQSEHIIVRRSRARENVAGIEIENSIDADVYLNYATNNTGGLLIFDNPGLQRYGCRAHTDPAKDQPNCRGTRAWANWIIDNNHENFANGGTVALVPPGTGTIIMATDTVELFNNVIHNHQTVNSVVISFKLTQIPINDPAYDPYPERIEIHDNEYADGGYGPVGDLGNIMSLSFNPIGTPPEDFLALPDVLYENIYLDPTMRIRLDPPTPARYALPESVAVCAHDNHYADGSPAGWARSAGHFDDPELYACEHPRRDATVLEPISEPPIVEDPYTPEEIAAFCGAVVDGVNWAAYAVDCPVLSDYQLYQDPTEPRSAPNAGGTPFDLTTPLFSDYAQKDRIVYIPPGQQATYSDSGIFEFPVGTIISKTFTFGHDLRAPGVRGDDMVETRLLIHRPEGWKGRAYIWNDDHTEAFLAVGGGQKLVSWIASDGTQRETHYQVPNIAQCSRCHSGANGDEPIGPKARLLNRDFDYGSGPENQLAHWSAAGILAGAPADPSTAPALPLWADPNDGTLEQRARAYLESNCAHCHNPGGGARFTGLYLEASRPIGGQVGVCKRPGSAGAGAGGLDYDIVPGEPDSSIMIYRMASVSAQIKMPELAKSVVHDEGVQTVAAWIDSLTSPICPEPTGGN